MHYFLTIMLAALAESAAQEAPQLVDTVQEFNQDHAINWTKLRFEGYAQSKPNTPTDDFRTQESRALTFATTALRDSFGKLNITGALDLSNLSKRLPNSAETDRVQRYMNEQSKRTGVANTTYHENGTVKISVFLDIHSVVRPALLLLAGEHITSRPKQHTGLVIDARNLSFRPVLLPTFSYSSENEIVDPAETRSIRSSSGRLAGFSIGVSEFSVDSAQTKLPMIYANSPFHPEAQSRAGKKPSFFVASDFKDGVFILNALPTALSSVDLKSIAARGDIVVLVDPEKLR